MHRCRGLRVFLFLWIASGVVTNPVKRSADIEERRRSAISRGIVRLGRSFPAAPSAAEIRDFYQRHARRPDSFVRLGRSNDDLNEDLYYLGSPIDEDKRGTGFIRFGRDPSFVRFGRSVEEEATVNQGVGYPQRSNRVTDHFVRLGRDSELLDDVEDEMRKKREVCHDCV